MYQQEKVEQALNHCYDAISLPSTWGEALHGLAQSVNAVGCGFFPQNAGQMRLSFPASPGYGAFLEDFLKDDWWRRDHRAARGWPLARAGRRVFIDHDIASDDERKTLPQYCELYARHDVPWWAAVVFPVDHQPWVMPLLRSKSQGPFTREDAEQLLALRPQLKRLLKLANTVAAVAGESTLNVLEQVGCAAMLIDWRGEVFRLNARAEALLGTELVLVKRHLAATRRDNNAPLQRLMGQAIAAPTTSAFLEEPVAIVRTGRRPLLIDAIPTTGVLSDAFNQARAVLLLSDLDERPVASHARLRSIFGLTPTEARLAALVGGGEDLHKASEELKIARTTARVHLKKVFAKTDTNRQAELVALVSRVTGAGRR